MGNHNSQTRSRTNSKEEHQIAVPTRSESTKAYTPCLEKLFQKLELTADNNNEHPGEITRTTFEKAFHGPLHVFGKLLYNQMCDNSRKERITREQFIKSGKEIVQMFDETAQHKYYFRLFANGKDSLDKEDAQKMVNVSYALTLSSSMIPYSCSPQDDKLFESMALNMFGIKDTLNFDSFSKWLAQHCPHMFSGVHNWVHQILTGSKMPSELETAPFPLLERFVEGKHCISMGMLWALSATIPYQYTHSAKEDTAQQDTSPGFKNPLLTSYHLLMKLLKLETNWNENPDKQLLNWGGIQTDHQHSREGGF